MIISAYTGWPGCAHDAWVLRNSTLFTKGENGMSKIVKNVSIMYCHHVGRQ